ncbi:MAG: nucleotidyltransferase family protein, partial [Candidatus Eremiobacteraeota bacterium]|nr:nucleotidyltransferase family protein [Candidatus Eremiobacteraeota bacterium]
MKMDTWEMPAARVVVSLFRDLLHGRAERARALLRETDPRLVAQACKRHKCCALLHWLLQKNGIQLDGFLGDYLRSAFFANWTRNRELLLIWNEVASALEVEACRPLAWKGLSLASRVFGNLACRRISDLDVIVPREKLSEAGRVLERLGYRYHSRSLGRSPIGLRWAHAVEFQREDGQKVDLHHALRRHPTFKLASPSLWEHSERWEIGENFYAVPGPEDTLLGLLLELQDDIGRGGSHLRVLVDLWFTLEANRGIDWEQFLEARRAERTDLVVLNGLTMFMILTEGREHFPALQTFLGNNRLQILPVGEDEALRLFCNRTWSYGKLWAWRQYRCSLWRACLEWMISLPFRLAAFGRIKNRAS